MVVARTTLLLLVLAIEQPPPVDRCREVCALMDGELLRVEGECTCICKVPYGEDRETLPDCP